MGFLSQSANWEAIRVLILQETSEVWSSRRWTGPKNMYHDVQILLNLS
jgi:hypothetical protein